MIVNHRPHSTEFLFPLVEDINGRFSEEDQQFIVDTVVEVLGMPRTPYGIPEGEAQNGEQNGHMDVDG